MFGLLVDIHTKFQSYSKFLQINTADGFKEIYLFLFILISFYSF